MPFTLGLDVPSWGDEADQRPPSRKVLPAVRGLVQVTGASTPSRHTSGAKADRKGKTKRSRKTTKHQDDQQVVAVGAVLQKPKRESDSPKRSRTSLSKHGKRRRVGDRLTGAYDSPVSSDHDARKRDRSEAASAKKPKSKRKAKETNPDEDGRSAKKPNRSPLDGKESSSKQPKNKIVQVTLPVAAATGVRAGTPNELQNRGTEVTAKRTKRVSKAEKRLQGARFRMLNEKLYTTTGEEAFNLFSSNPELFRVYHDGFQTQVTKWPVNPVDKAIGWIKERGSNDIVADFGCGEAAIAQSVPNKVHSFDLVAHNGHVTACDIAHVPLKNASVDISVFCLALMGTNYLDYVKEAHRVLKKGKDLLIYEVVSRISDTDRFIEAVESVGFEFITQDASNKMFVFLHFTKSTGSVNDVVSNVSLQPCIYKRR